jgi:hypothetical protein
MKQPVAYTASEDGKIIFPLTSTTAFILFGLSLFLIAFVLVGWVLFAILGEIAVYMLYLAFGIGLMWLGFKALRFLND